MHHRGPTAFLLDREGKEGASTGGRKWPGVSIENPG